MIQAIRTAIVVTSVMFILSAVTDFVEAPLWSLPLGFIIAAATSLGIDSVIALVKKIN